MVKILAMQGTYKRANVLQSPDCYAELIRDGAHEHAQKESISMTSIILNISLSYT
jgi:hypothetical protein